MGIWYYSCEDNLGPDQLFRQAKATAANHGQSLKDFFMEALTMKLANLSSPAAKPWMKHFGTLRHLEAERALIEERIIGEFESIDREAWN